MGKYEAERFELQRGYFNKSLDRLHEALAENETSFVRDSIVKRFEVTFEMGWKSMYRFLSDKGEDLPPKAWDVLPAAFEARLITDADTWEQMRTYRNDTSHEYKEAKAIEIAAFVRQRAVVVFEALRQELARRG